MDQEIQIRSWTTRIGATAMPIDEERVSNRLQSAYVIVIGPLTAIALSPYQLILDTNPVPPLLL